MGFLYYARSVHIKLATGIMLMQSLLTSAMCRWHLSGTFSLRHIAKKFNLLTLVNPYAKLLQVITCDRNFGFSLCGDPLMCSLKLVSISIAFVLAL